MHTLHNSTTGYTNSEGNGEKEMIDKLELLRKLHTLVWKDDDLMDQDTLSELQYLIDSQIIEEANEGNLVITQLSNGYIKSIRIPKK